MADLSPLVSARPLNGTARRFSARVGLTKMHHPTDGYTAAAAI
jgi:hypothetical protein